MDSKIFIFDTTLRDGEQSPGASLNVSEKVEIARQLEKLGVDVIEAGFPVSSPKQFDAVQGVAEEVSVAVAALARAKEKDIDAAWQAIRHAQKPRIHTFSSTSDYHIMGKFGSPDYGRTLAQKRQTILRMTSEAVRYARSLCADVEYSAEDAGRTDIGYLCEIVQTAIEAGASTINIPDTTGYTLPDEFAGIIRALRDRVRSTDRIILSVHCHNDLGLGVANSLAAIMAGARQIECTINGIGERAGNASLEEIVMALRVRQKIYGVHTDIDTTELYNTSRMVSGFTGLIVQPNKAIVGENAFAHESGIHQDGMIKDRNTYEIITPEDVGVPKTKIVLGRHSGRHGLKARLDELGYSLTPAELTRIYDRFTELADKKKEIFDDDLRILMGDEILKEKSVFQLISLQVHAGSDMIPTATVKIFRDNMVFQESATGDGPVDAVFNAIDRAIDRKYTVESYHVRSVTAGRQALGEVQVRVRNGGGNAYNGRGVSTDILEASAKAYIQALNILEESEPKSERELISNYV